MNTNEIIEKAKERLTELKAEAAKLRAIIGDDAADTQLRRRDVVRRLLGERMFVDIYSTASAGIDVDRLDTDLQLAASITDSFTVGARIMPDDMPRFTQGVKDATVMFAAACALMRHPETMRVCGDVTKTNWYQLGLLTITNVVNGARKGCAG